MLELSAHILDIAENSVRAGATKVEIIIDEDSAKNLLTIEINDNGSGMAKEEIKKAFDPFYTTKKVRRFGLGIPLLADAAHRAGGRLDVQSEQGKGTTLKAAFQLDHWDRQPMGDLIGTLITLIAGNCDIDFLFIHKNNDRQFAMDTREIRQEINDIPLNHPEILKYIRGVLEDGLS
jgi:hypothetical protein